MIKLSIILQGSSFRVSLSIDKTKTIQDLKVIVQ